MAFQVLEVSLEMTDLVGELLQRIRRHDRAMADQIRRSASSVAMNIAEGEHRRDGDRNHLFRIAAGSANETRTALRICVSWKYLDRDQIDPILLRLDRVMAMLHRLIR